MNLVGIIGIVFAVALVFVGWIISVYNSIIVKQQALDEAKADVEVYMVKRYDVIMNSYKIAKQYMDHENAVFTQLSQIRSGMSISELGQQGKLQNNASKAIWGIVESYPELKSNEIVLKLQTQLEDQNEHYAASKRLYNSNVNLYNQYILTMPNNIIANCFGVKKADYFVDDTADSKRNVAI